MEIEDFLFQLSRSSLVVVEISAAEVRAILPDGDDIGVDPGVFGWVSDTDPSSMGVIGGDCC